MSDHPKMTAVPTEWLTRVVMLLNTMAGEGMGMDGCAEPADMMCEIADVMGCGETDDPWQAVTLALAGEPTP